MLNDTLLNDFDWHIFIFNSRYKILLKFIFILDKNALILLKKVTILNYAYFLLVCIKMFRKNRINKFKFQIYEYLI